MEPNGPTNPTSFDDLPELDGGLMAVRGKSPRRQRQEPKASARKLSGWVAPTGDPNEMRYVAKLRDTFMRIWGPDPTAHHLARDDDLKGRLLGRSYLPTCYHGQLRRTVENLVYRGRQYSVAVCGACNASWRILGDDPREERKTRNYRN